MSVAKQTPKRAGTAIGKVNEGLRPRIDEVGSRQHAVMVRSYSREVSSSCGGRWKPMHDSGSEALPKTR